MTEEDRPVIISIDSREKDKEFIEYLTRYGAFLDEGFFEIGDLGIKGDTNFVIEHKSVNDFGTSLQQGRLFRQVRDMVINAGDEYQPILLLVGDIWKLWKIRGYSSWQIAAAINAIQFGMGVPVLMAHNNMFAAMRLVLLAKKYQNPKKESKPHPMRFLSRTSMTEEEEVLYVLEGFPGISAIRARKLLNHYKTLSDTLVAMQTGRISEVKGFGEKISKNIMDVFKYNRTY